MITPIRNLSVFFQKGDAAMRIIQLMRAMVLQRLNIESGDMGRGMGF